MTVAELIAALTALEDHSRKVWVEGCDCSNEAARVSTVPADEFDGDPAYVLIRIS